MLTRLNYDNATLAGLPVILFDRLQSVLNASARSISGLCRAAHITDTLASFHWLRVHERIEFKLAVFCIPSSPWHRAPISVRYADTRCWRTISESSSFVDFQSARRPSVAPCHYRGLFVHFRWPETLEQSSGRRYGCLFTARVSTLTENTSIPAILSGCYLVACLWRFLAMVDLAVIYSGHLKNLYVM